MSLSRPVTALSLALFTAFVLPVSAMADCPARAPAHGWNVQGGDRRVNAGFLENALVGHTVLYDLGGGTATEQFARDGSHVWSSGGASRTAPTFRFYRDGVRCIGYAQPRFDLFVIANKRLVLIDTAGQRHGGALQD